MTIIVDVSQKQIQKSEHRIGLATTAIAAAAANAFGGRKPGPTYGFTISFAFLLYEVCFTFCANYFSQST